MKQMIDIDLFDYKKIIVSKAYECELTISRTVPNSLGFFKLLARKQVTRE